MMTREEFNAFCATLPAATHVVQWGKADVWKLGGKVCAICGWNEGRDAFPFKASDVAFNVLRDHVRASHEMVAAKLTRAVRAEPGLGGSR